MRGRLSDGDLGLSRFNAGRFSGRQDPAFSVASIFGAGIIGEDWHFRREFCFTETGGVYEPVTTTGDAIARIVGAVNGVQANQTTLSRRPLYGESGDIGWALFNGSSHVLVTDNIVPGWDKAQAVAAFLHASAAAPGDVFSLSTNIANFAGTVNLTAAPTANPGTIQFRARGSGSIGQSYITAAAPGTYVVTGIADIATDLCEGRANSVSAGTSAIDMGTGNFLTYPLHIGARQQFASIPFNGRIYSLTLRFGPTLTPPQIGLLEAVAARRAGILI